MHSHMLACRCAHISMHAHTHTHTHDDDNINAETEPDALYCLLDIRQLMCGETVPLTPVFVCPPDGHSVPGNRVRRLLPPQLLHLGKAFIRGCEFSQSFVSSRKLLFSL